LPSADEPKPGSFTTIAEDGSWMMHVHPHDALADPLPFVMQDASPRPVGLLRSGFRELIQPTLTARASWTWTGLVKTDEIS
jgi:hypothetical protein